MNGFYVRDAAFLYEDTQLTDESQLGNTQEYVSFSHNFTRDLPESYQAVNDIFSNIMQPRLGDDRYIFRPSFTSKMFKIMKGVSATV